MRITKKLFINSIVATLISSTLINFNAANVQAQDLLPEDNGLEFSKYHQSPQWRESEASPFRIFAYALHPFGWALREGIFRPLSYLMSTTEETRSVFGYQEPFGFRKAVCMKGSEKIPNCRMVSPYNNIFKDDEVAGDGESKADGSVIEGDAAKMVSESQVVFQDVAFDHASSSLNTLGKGRVRQVAQLLSSMPTVKVSVEGHTDQTGSADYNKSLGMKRAQTVVKELSELGIDPARMSPISYGKDKLLYTQDEEWAKALNRRVHFEVQGDQVASVDSGELPPPASDPNQ
jgi:outer membrane protein OmpA-like peptidoglycan-associated protein